MSPSDPQRRFKKETKNAQYRHQKVHLFSVKSMPLLPIQYNAVQSNAIQ